MPQLARPRLEQRVIRRGTRLARLGRAGLPVGRLARELVAARGIGVHRQHIGERRLDLLHRIPRVAGVDHRPRRLRGVGAVAEQHRHRGVLVGDLQQLDLVVDRRVAARGDEVAVAGAELHLHRPALGRNRLLDQPEHPLGEPVPVHEVVRIDLDRRVVVVRGQQDQPRRVDAQLGAHPLPQDGGGDIQTVQVVGDEDQPAATVVEHQHPRVDVLLGALRHPAVHHDERCVVGDHPLGGAGGHRLCRRRAGQTEHGAQDPQRDEPVHHGCHLLFLLYWRALSEVRRQKSLMKPDGFAGSCSTSQRLKPKAYSP